MQTLSDAQFSMDPGFHDFYTMNSEAWRMKLQEIHTGTFIQQAKIILLGNTRDPTLHSCMRSKQR